MKNTPNPRENSRKPLSGLILALKSMILGLHTEAKTLSSGEVMIQLYIAQVEQYCWFWHISARLTWMDWRNVSIEKKGLERIIFLYYAGKVMYYIWLSSDLS